MPLYIKDDEVDDLVEQIMRDTGAKTKVAAVRSALKTQIASTKQEKSIMEQVENARKIARKIGQPDPDFIMGWSGTDVH